MSASVIEGPAEPAIADERRSGRGRGRGTGGYCRVHTSKFAINEAIDRFADLACRTDHVWSWDGTSYPKTKRSDGPNVEGLAMHNEPLKILLQLAPNGYPDPYRLRDLLMKMHSLFNIFAECHTEGYLSPSSRAALAADRWCTQCRHLIMLKRCGQDYDNPLIKDLLATARLASADQRLAEAPAPAELAAALAPAEPAEGPPPSAEETPEWYMQPVPCTADGDIDWGGVEDQMPEIIDTDGFECEVRKLDFTGPLPSNIHPYFHSAPEPDCIIVGHKCNCPSCKEVVDVSSPGPARKKCKAPQPTGPQAAGELIEGSLAPGTPSIFEADQSRRQPPPAEPAWAGPVWEVNTQPFVDSINSQPMLDLRVPGSPMPDPRTGIAMPENLESMTDPAAVPYTAEKEKQACAQKGKGGRTRLHVKTRPPSKAEEKEFWAEPAPEPAEPAPKPSRQSKVGGKGKPKCQGKSKGAKARPTVDRDDLKISGPFSLHYRWAPPEKAYCFMMGKVEGDDTRSSITKMSVQMNTKFCDLMQILLEDAKAGRIATKGDAIKRRAELVTTPAEPAAAAERVQEADVGEAGVQDTVLDSFSGSISDIY